MNKTKKSLLMSAISLLLCISMLIGSTFAWFTDSVSSVSNKIQSGTLKVDLELLDKETGVWNSLKESQAPIFNYDKWEPGYVDIKVLKVENEGNLALKWVAKFCSEYQLSILTDVIDVYVRPSESEIGYPTDRNLEGYTCVGNLRTFINSIEETTYGALEAKEASYLGLALKMREDAGNEYQDLSLGGAFDIRIYATQYTSESDSFDNQYDKNAMFDMLADKSILTSQSKCLNDGADSVDFAVYHKGVKIVGFSVPEDAIANKDKPITVTIRAIDPYVAVSQNTQAYAYDIDVTNLKSDLKGDQLVTVVISAPKGLASMKVYHKNEIVQDAAYDEVAGTITFKTASFSPFEVTADVVTVERFEDLRDAMQSDGANIALGAHLTVDLSKDSALRDKEHAYPNAENAKYYNGVKVQGRNVSLDLNGYGITVSCGEGLLNDNDDVGALFYVAEKGSLNINDSVGTGFIKMKSSIYAVWAPHADPSYVDIYGGIFIADSYAGDPIGTPVDGNGKADSVNGTMSNEQENANRALIYAGRGGNINVYGGYFLYNNTLNDGSNRNNGAFNAKDYYEDGALITIHKDVYLSNKEYRQNPYRNPQTNPSFDDYSVVLSQYSKISETTVNKTIKIGDEDFNHNWYKVVPTYAYKVIFMNSDGTKELDTQYIMSNTDPVTVDNIDGTACENLDSSYTGDFGGWVNAASEKVDSIDAGNSKDIVLRPTYSKKYTVTWLNEDGAVLNSVQTSGDDPRYSSISGSEPTNTASKYGEVMKFSHWEVRKVDGNGKVTSEKITSNYPITRDISLYPIYEYNGSLDLIAVDTDGDGIANHYAVAGSDLSQSPDFVIPEIVNGIKVEEIRTGAFADGDLRDVIIPKSITYIGANAFCADKNYSSIFNPGEYPQIQIIFEGTRAQWDAIPKDSGWHDNIGTHSVIICTKENPIGYYEQTGTNPTMWNGGKTDIVWSWNANSTPSWYPRTYN